MTIPVSGYDALANNDDSYFELLAARTGQEVYNFLIAWVSTYDAVLSLDGGTTDHITLQAGAAPLLIPFTRRQGAVHGKNAVGANDYTALYVTIGYDPSKG